MRRFILLSSFAVLAGCEGEELTPPLLDPMVANAAVTDAQRYLGDGAQVLAVCGASVGRSYYLNETNGGLIEDGIADGLIIFAITPDGRPEILTRDVFQEMIVASEDGGAVARLPGQDGHPLGSWTVQYPSTGVVESHTFSLNEVGNLVDVWVQNKPPVSPLPARASIFLSMCETNL